VRRVRRSPESPSDGVLGVLHSCPATGEVTLRFAATSRRSQAPLAALLRSAATATHCRIALAETTCITVRWVDGFVTGTVDELSAFLAGVSPQLMRAHGEVSLAAAA
jgi:hypothetical protein